jgi:hypothetical protein
LEKAFRALASRIDGIIQHVDQRVAPFVNQLHQTTTRITQENQAALERQTEAEFDEALDGLGEQYKPLLGTLKDRKAGTPQYKLAAEIWDTLPVLIQNYQAKGIRFPGMKELTRRAVAVVCADRTHELVRNEINGQIQGRRANAIGRPRQGAQQAVAKPMQHLREALAKIKGRGDYGEGEGGF